MHFDFQILGSSSSGNCALLKTSKACILIDAGFSAKKIKSMLEALGESIEGIHAVFITHEHADHIAGLQGLSAYPHIEFFTNEQTAQSIQAKLKRKINFKIFQTGSTFEFKGLQVQNFSIPHDAYDPVGYIFTQLDASPNSSYKSIAWLTDLGHISDPIGQKVKNADILVLEANYDPGLLEKDTIRPFPVKQRIRSRHGHLSNQDAYQFLYHAQDFSWKKIYLAHLSPHCNCKKLVEDTFSSLIQRHNQYQITVIDPLGASLILENSN